MKAITLSGSFRAVWRTDGGAERCVLLTHLLTMGRHKGLFTGTKHHADSAKPRLVGTIEH